MGTLNAMGMAEAVQNNQIDLRRALSWNLTVNHFPALPVEYVEVMVDVVNAVNSGDLDLRDEVTLPADLSVVPSRAERTDDGWVIPAGDLLSITHSESFIDPWVTEEYA